VVLPTFSGFPERPDSARLDARGLDGIIPAEKREKRDLISKRRIKK
jgi:hypothetical protein